MNTLDSMLERNKDFVAKQAPVTLMPSLPRAMPNVKAIIIGCADMRVDPAHIFGIKPGEAVVIRNTRWSNHAGVVGAVGSPRANR
jgi:carbonic anhydrase